MIEIGQHVECANCGETLIRTSEDQHDELEDYREVASGQLHECWTQLPFGVEHLRLD